MMMSMIIGAILLLARKVNLEQAVAKYFTARPQAITAAGFVICLLLHLLLQGNLLWRRTGGKQAQSRDGK